MRVTKLEGPLLDFWVAKSEGLEVLSGSLESGAVIVNSPEWDQARDYHPSTDWSQGGPIVSNEWYDLEVVLEQWFGGGWPQAKGFCTEPLQWFMRAYVALKFGDEVEDMVCRPAEVAKPEPLQERTSRRRTVLGFVRGLGRPAGTS